MSRFSTWGTVRPCGTRSTSWSRRGQRERADLDLAPVAVFSRISRLARHLDLARRQAFTEHGIESWEFDVLAALRRAGAPYELSPGRLLRETLVTSGTMTNRVDRLAARGLVERYPDPHDRRGVSSGSPREGKATVDGAFEALLEAERDLLADLPAGDQDGLAGLLRDPARALLLRQWTRERRSRGPLVRAARAAADHRATVADRPVARGSRADAWAAFDATCPTARRRRSRCSTTCSARPRAPWRGPPGRATSGS